MVLAKISSAMLACAGLVLCIGLMLLSTGEANLKPNPLFKAGVSALYIVALCFILSAIALPHFKQNLAHYFARVSLFFILLLGIIALSLLSLYFTADRHLSWSFMRRFLLEPSLFLLLISLYFYTIKPSSQARIIYAFLIIFSLQPIFTIGDFIYYGLANDLSFIAMLGSYRPMPFFFAEAQTGYAFFLIISLSLSVALFYTKPSKLALLLVGLNILACIVANTRFLHICLCVIMLLPAILLPYRYKSRILAGVSAVALLCGVGFYYVSAHLSPRYNLAAMLDNFAQVWSLPPAAMGRFDNNCDSVQHCMPESFPRDPSLIWEHSSLNRLAMSKATWLGILDNPLRPNGFGLGLFAKNIVRIFGSGEQIPYYIHRHDDGSVLPFYWTNHNGILYLWFELGIVGFGLIVWLHLWLLLQARKLYECASLSTISRAFALGLSLSILGLIVANCFDALPNRAGTLVLFLLFGLLIALIAKYGHKESA